MNKDLTIKHQIAKLKANGRKVKLPSTLKHKLTINSNRGKGIVFCLDFSGSMYGQKIDHLKQATLNLIEKYPEARIVKFSDYHATEILPEDIHHHQPTSTTPMLEGLMLAWGMSPTHIILVTDGKPTDAHPNEIVQEAEMREVKISCLGIGEGYYDFDEQFLKQLAAVTGGEYGKVGEEELLKLEQTMENLLLTQDAGKGSINL